MKTLATMFVVGLLSFAGAANAQPVLHLSRAEAEHAIIAYEQGYWKKQHPAPQHIWITSCQRQTPARLRCLVIAAEPDHQVQVWDQATKIRPGLIRVHPGTVFTEITVLEEANI